MRVHEHDALAPKQPGDPRYVANQLGQVPWKGSADWPTPQDEVIASTEVDETCSGPLEGRVVKRRPRYEHEMFPRISGQANGGLDDAANSACTTGVLTQVIREDLQDPRAKRGVAA
jgi:hypothetical protein